MGGLFLPRGPASARTRDATVRLRLLPVLLALVTLAGTAAGKPARRVLVLHAYHPGFTWTDSITEGIARELPAAGGFELLVEHMDSKRHFSDEHLTQLCRLYELKYRDRQPEVVLASDDNALDFLLDHRDDLFPGVPVVFCGVNDFQDSRLAGQKGYTGVNESPDFRKTLELALRLHPETRRVVVVSDQTTTGLANTSIVQRFAPVFADRVSFDWLTNRTVAELREELRGLPRDAVVLSLSFYRDREGTPLSIEENTRLIAGSSPVPVYTAWDFGMRNGVMGGHLVSGVAQGRTAALLARRILDGEPVERVPVVRQSPNVTVLEWSALRRFGVDESRLPPGSVVRNRPRSFYEEYRPWIWAAGAFILTEAALIVLLLAAHARRRRAEEALSRQNERLGVLNRVAQVTLGATEPEEMCDALVETLRGVLPADRICVHSIADRAAGPVATACFDTTGRRVTRVMERSRDELCSREVEEAVIRERRPLRISLDGSPAGAGGAGSGVRIPMIVGDRVVGILSVLAREENAYDADDVQLLSSIAREVGPALEAVLLASQLRESREVLRATLNSTADGILVVDSAGDVLVANPRFGRLWNLPEHLLRKGIADRDLVETVLGQVADPAGFQARIAHLYQSSVESLDEIRLKDGRVLERFSCPLIRDGSEIGRVWNFRDITQRKEAEEATLHGARVTEAVAEASLSYLETGSVRTMTQTIVDRALEITGARVGMILERDRQGQPRILSVSSSVWEALTDERLREELRRSLEDGGRYPLPVADSLLQVPLEEGRAILTNRAFEQPRWHGVVPGHLPIDSFLGVPMKVGTEVLGVLALANREGGFDDRQLEEAEAFAVTAVLALRAARTEEERAVIESQLRQSQKLEAIGQLAGGVAHDFNNILQAILGYAELARMRLPKGHPVGPSLDEVRKATDRAISLVRQLLVFGRREPLKPDDIDLNGLVDDLLKMLRRVIGEQVDLEVDRGEDLWTIRADPGRMEQLVINLCVNARDAMPDGGRIRIETRNELLTPAFVAENPWAREGRYVRLVVSDTGSGIPEEVLDHIFEPFFTTKDVGQGTGLGLATVYGIVEQHHGMIDVRSEPGEGATFRVYLPAGSREVVAPGPGDRETVVEGGRETILLAEDDPGVRTLMTHILEEEGYTVLVTENGEDAVREFAERSHEIDLALLDVVMPKMSGRQVLEVIRDIAPGIPVLFSSGYSPDHVAGEIAGDGRTALVSKPCGRHELLRTIRSCWRGRRRRVGEGAGALHAHG